VDTLFGHISKHRRANVSLAAGYGILSIGGRRFRLFSNSRIFLGLFIRRCFRFTCTFRDAQKFNAEVGHICSIIIAVLFLNDR
jgi:hypothetical protein